MNEFLRMMMDAVLPNILEIVATIISLVVAYYVIPCIKNDLVPWLKEKRLYSTVKKFVRAAEKLAESGVISKESKKDEVVKLLEKNGIVVTDTIDSFIESAVKELDIIVSTIYDEVIVETDEDVEVEVEEPEVIIETENV